MLKKLFIRIVFVLVLTVVLNLLLTGSGDSKTIDVGDITHKLRAGYGLKLSDKFFLVNIGQQRMYLIQNSNVIRTYIISTSKFGIDSEKNSDKTPLGTHRIKKKIGAGEKLGSIFVGRKNTGKIAKIYNDKIDTADDYVTSRIMWLEGLEPGLNKGFGIDSFHRYIYIHGTPEEGLLGQPASHGCIRMGNKDIIELFDIVPEGTLVEIITGK